jgi:malonyl-CoA decarboxylase
MRESLDPRGGEIRARSRAAALGQVFLSLNARGRAEFLRILAREFDLDPEEVSRAAEHLSRAADPLDKREARRELLAAVESPRAQILRRFNALPQGVKFLVDLRAELLHLARKEPVLGSLDDDLKAILTSWFDVDFLDLRRISWNTASGALLEKFMAYEAVHPVEDWEDLKNRLERDRRYFAFFHPRMPDEPLIFVEVALVKGMADNIQALLDPAAPVGDPEKADTAIFYSISNAQRGLAGISFGGFLIKQVVNLLVNELPELKTFATLSPVPGLRKWLESVLAGEGEVLRSTELKRIRLWTGSEEANRWILRCMEESLWRDDAEIEKEMKAILLRLAARYLAREKREGGRTVQHAARDPVAHFHLSNGARIERLIWAADTSTKGLAQSAGIMVNYLYDPKAIEENHEVYRSGGEVAVSSAVRSLLKG